jgi:hypothetical protein
MQNMASERLKIVSLGADQTEGAVKSLEAATKEGNWVLLQNTHLSLDFLPTVEKVLRQPLLYSTCREEIITNETSV